MIGISHTCILTHKHAIACRDTHREVQKDACATVCVSIIHQITADTVYDKQRNSRDSGFQTTSLSRLSRATVRYMDFLLNVIYREHNIVLSQSKMTIQLAWIVCFLMKF